MFYTNQNVPLKYLREFNVLFILSWLGSVCPEKLIAYAHKISQANSAISPVGWQPSKSQNKINKFHVRLWLSCHWS